MRDYRSPWWLPGGHAQTIWPALFSRRWMPGLPVPAWRRERWTTPDEDFIDVDFLGDGGPGAGAASVESPEPHSLARQGSAGSHAARPLLVLFHGLEGSSSSAYAQAFADEARRRGWSMVVPHFRGCSGELNRAPRAYHSGDHEEIGWILKRLHAAHHAPLMAVGISLGGNALMRWAQEAGDTAAAVASGVVSVCSPLDLTASGNAIGQGFNRQVYTRMFLRTMKPRALAKWAQFPGLFDREKLLAARDLREFDEVFTAPLHGFKGTDDYWHRASAKPHLHRLRIPALAINALNDPFVPAASLPRASEVSDTVELWQPAHGGHVGFPAGAPPGHVLAMPRAVCGWLASATTFGGPPGGDRTDR